MNQTNKKHIKQQILETIANHNEGLAFEQIGHTYTYKNKPLTSVSETIPFYKKGLQYIPEAILTKAIARGNIIHKKLEEFVIVHTEWINGTIKDSPYYYPQLAELIKSDRAYNEAIDYIITLKENGYEVLATELMLLNKENNIAGTVDNLWIKIEDNKITLLISDWKTGHLQIGHYAQIGIYKGMLHKIFKNYKYITIQVNDGWEAVDLEIKTQLVCLKT